MKKCTRVFSMILTMFLVLSVLAGSGIIQAKPTVKVSSIKIKNTKKKFRIQKGMLRSRFLPTKASTKK